MFGSTRVHKMDPWGVRLESIADFFSVSHFEWVFKNLFQWPYNRHFLLNTSHGMILQGTYIRSSYRAPKKGLTNGPFTGVPHLPRKKWHVLRTITLTTFFWIRKDILDQRWSFRVRNSFVFWRNMWATKKNGRILSIESWLFNRDPYRGFWNNPHITG